MTVAYLWHEGFGWADTGTGGVVPSSFTGGVQPLAHVANPDTKRRLHELLALSGILERTLRVAPVPASEQDILRVHTAEYVERMKAASKEPKGGDCGDGVSPFGQGGFELALLSAGGAMTLVDAVLDGRADTGYANINPPGHHACPDTGMGFCMFNNVSVAAAHARARGVERVAIVDVDVHHGNGTQAIWWDDPSVLALSVHQDGCFPPNSGHVHERGGEKALGSTINIPLPPGGGDGLYKAVFDEVVAPALAEFDPELILVASGFDAGMMDPLARMMVTTEGFRSIADCLLRTSVNLDAKIAFIQEGGYSPMYVPFCGAAVMETLIGERLVDDPMWDLFGAMGGDVIREHERQVLDRIKAEVLSKG